jgi:hypothetical protein
MEGSGRGLIRGAIPAFYWKNWGKPRETLVRITGLRAEIWTQKKECWPFNMGILRLVRQQNYCLDFASITEYNYPAFLKKRRVNLDKYLINTSSIRPNMKEGTAIVCKQ